MQYEGYPLIPETATDGFTYGAITPVGQEVRRGAGFLEGPDGSRAGLQWELSDDGPYIARVEGPGENHWGVYRVGFTRPVRTVADLTANLRELLPKLQILYTRARVQ
ncbi:MAG: 3-deoxy-8-phosphooctulonate synthase [Bacillota bacterium]